MLRLLITLLIMIMPVQLLANSSNEINKLPDAKTMYTLHEIQSDIQNDASIITISLDKKPGTWSKLPEIEDHGTFIQLILPNTITPNPGTFYDVKSKYIAKIGAFQLRQNDTGLRFFVGKDASKIKDFSSIDLLDQNLVFNFNHKKFEESLSQEPVIASTSLTETDLLKTPAMLLKNPEDNSTAVSAGTLGLKNPGELRSKLISVSLFIGIMLFGLVILWMFRPMLSKGRIAKKFQPEVSIKTVAVHALAPKQKLALIDVDGEQILIGLTSEHINYISTINKKKEQPVIRQSLQPQLKRPVVTKPMSLPSKTQQQPAQRSSFEARIDDAGVHETKHETTSQGDKTIEDVTNIIRQKLKNLPSIS